MPGCGDPSHRDATLAFRHPPGGNPTSAPAADVPPADPVAVLRDVPAPLWGVLVRAVRRAADRVDRAEVPVELRPFATWKPERLAGDVPRRAVATALARDPRLREAVGEALDPALWEDAQGADAGRLVLRHGAEAAVAGLAARGRWDDLAVVASQGPTRSPRGTGPRRRRRAGCRSSPARTRAAACWTSWATRAPSATPSAAAPTSPSSAGAGPPPSRSA